MTATEILDKMCSAGVDRLVFEVWCEVTDDAVASESQDELCVAGAVQMIDDGTKSKEYRVALYSFFKEHAPERLKNVKEITE